GDAAGGEGEGGGVAEGAAEAAIRAAGATVSTAEAGAALCARAGAVAAKAEGGSTRPQAKIAVTERRASRETSRVGSGQFMGARGAAPFRASRAAIFAARNRRPRESGFGHRAHVVQQAPYDCAAKKRCPACAKPRGAPAADRRKRRQILDPLPVVHLVRGAHGSSGVF